MVLQICMSHIKQKETLVFLTQQRVSIYQSINRAIPVAPCVTSAGIQLHVSANISGLVRYLLRAS